MYSIKSPQTRRRYQDRFKTFLDFLEIKGKGIEERINNFYDLAKENPQFLQDSLLNFFIYQKELVSKGEIVASSISNYYKPVKLFCKVNDILINWKFISREIPREKHNSFNLKIYQSSSERTRKLVRQFFYIIHCSFYNVFLVRSYMLWQKYEVKTKNIASNK
jgi:hypothetical protein